MTNENWQGINVKNGNPTIRDNTFNFGAPKQNPPNNIRHFIANTNFVGRQPELTKLRDTLQQTGAVAISAVAGMGGVGKTELAIQYVKQHGADYPGGICWLNARTSNLAVEILDFARLHMNLQVPQELGGQKLTLELEQQLEWIWQNWKPTEGVVLVVLDDVVNLESCGNVLRLPERFRVLITTRQRRLDTKFVEISLDVLSAEDALKLLIGVLGEQDQRVKQESQTAESLCAWLGYLPLGLELVGRYLVDDPDLSLAEMLQRLKNQSLQDEAVEPSQDQLKYTAITAERGVKAAFELSWLELNQKTQHVGELLSLFAPDVIPWKLVDSISKSLSWVEASVNKAKNQLYKLHLIQKLADKESAYKIHPLIREFLRVKLAASELAASEQADSLKHAFANTLAAIAKKIPNSPTQEFINLIKDTIIPHVTEVAQNLTDAVSDENLIWVFIGLSRFNSRQGLYAQAEPWLKQGLSVAQSRLGEDNPDVAQISNSLALVYKDQGKYSEAEPLFIKALELRQRLLGEEDPEIGTIYNNLAGLYSDQGNDSEAEQLYIKALELWQRLLGEEYPEIPIVYYHLAELYGAQERFSEAEPLHVKALELGQRLLGQEHPDVGRFYSGLAALYYYQQRYEEAEPLYNKALELLQRLLGEQHPETARIYNNLAGLYGSQGRYTEAESLYNKALKLLQGRLGEEHPKIATVYNSLAELYKDQGRYSEAKTLYIKALELRQRLLGEEHPDVVLSYNSLAELYKDQGMYSKAEPLYIKALELCQRRLGEEHPDVVLSYNSLAELYQSQGRYPEAEPLYIKALELRQRLLGEEDSDVAQSYNNLAVLYSYQGRYSEAELLYQKALQLYQRVLKEENIRVANTYDNLAGLYGSQGRYTEAEPLFQKALALRQRLLGEEHPSVATSYNNLAKLYSSQKRYTEAELLFKKALQLCEQQLGVGHSETIMVRRSYANFLSNKRSGS